MKKGVEDLIHSQTELTAFYLHDFPSTGDFSLYSKLCNVTSVGSSTLVPPTPLTSLSQIQNSKSIYANDTRALHNFS